MLRLLVFAALVTVFALPSYAQDATPTQTPAAGPCTEAEAKAALYGKFRDNFNKGAEQQKVAYDAGKEYLGKYGACPDPADKTIATYIQNWITKYEAATLKFNCTKAVNESPATAFNACKPYVNANPDKVDPYLMLVAAGLKNVQAGNKGTNADAANAARRALQLIEQGKTTEVWAPLPSQAEAAPALNYYIGVFTFENAPAEAATYLVKAAQSNSSFAKEPTTYEFLAASYFKNEFTPLAAEYKAKCEGKEATPECDTLFNKINAVTHRIVDAYARSVALSPANAAAAKEDRRKKLSTFYKQLHDGKDDGLNELVAGILSKPIMLPGQEPPPPAPTTPATDGTNGTGGATTTPTTPAGGTTTPPAKPAATPTPTPKPAQKPPRS